MRILLKPIKGMASDAASRWGTVPSTPVKTRCSFPVLPLRPAGLKDQVNVTSSSTTASPVFLNSQAASAAGGKFAPSDFSVSKYRSDADE